MNESWWRHQMETFSALLAFVRSTQRSPVNSPHKSQWRGSLMFSLICVRMKGRVKTHEADDLGRHCAHHDVIVMWVDQLTGMAQAFSQNEVHIWYGHPIFNRCDPVTSYGDIFLCMVNIGSGNYLNRCRLMISKYPWHSPENCLSKTPLKISP